MDMLKSGQLVEVDKGGLVAQYVGQTAKDRRGIQVCVRWSAFMKHVLLRMMEAVLVRMY